MKTFVKQGIQYIRTNLEACTLAFLGSLSLAVHLLPFVLYGPHPLGYDTGFYRRYLIEPLTHFPNTPVPGLGNDALVPRMFFDLLRGLSLPPDIILYGSLITCFALVSLLLFIFLKPTLGTRGAFLASLLFIFSSVSYEAYWYMLVKNAFGLCFLLGAFIFFERRLFVPLLIIDIALALSHKTTALMYLATLGVLFLIAAGRRKEVLFHITLTSICLLAVAFPALHAVLHTAPVAVFLSWREYALFSLPLFTALIIGAGVFKHKKIPLTLLAFGSISVLLVAFHIPFYERLFIFADIALIALTAYALDFTLTRIEIKKIRVRTILLISVIAILAGLFFGNFVRQVKNLQPLMSGIDILRIEAIGELVPNHATLLTTSDEAPWFEGWTGAHIAAPGMLNDVSGHNLEAWTAFWNATSTEETVRFLNEFPNPLYISTLGAIESLVSVPPRCMQEIAPHLWRSTCEKMK